MTIVHNSMEMDSTYKDILGGEIRGNKIVHVTKGGEIIFSDGTWTEVREEKQEIERLRLIERR